MNIEVKVGRDSEDLEMQEMLVDGAARLSVQALCDCPEDAIIGRDLVSCRQVANYMREAWEAGKNGEEFSLEFSKMAHED